ncbi:MAG: carbamoyltransferase HypF [Lachnospira sp.]
MTKYIKIVVKGLVQGIGYRPFVAETAEKLNISGNVRNDAGVVTIIAGGRKQDIESFVTALRTDAPAYANVTDMTIEETYCKPESGFIIVKSTREEDNTFPYVPADLPTCGDCARELFDPDNRRFRHPFISCTSCGPRYSIIKKLPYDRENVTMSAFDMCQDCVSEYTGIGDRRRHAQTICCNECGPVLEFIDEDGNRIKGNKTAYDKALLALNNSRVVAIKDIGGYHLACNPYDKGAVEKLREIKVRERKPFAVMFKNVDEIKKYCHVSKQEKGLLESAARPIVLLRKRKDGLKFALGVCDESPDIGAMLPCNPVQLMLMEDCGPLIMTSANISGAPMFTENEDVIKWLSGKADILAHNRDILAPLDDSIVRVVSGKCIVIRRARGYVPSPVMLENVVSDSSALGSTVSDSMGNNTCNNTHNNPTILAAGADLKACLCLLESNCAVLSGYHGDLENTTCMELYTKEIARMKEIFLAEPDVYVVDKHPGYNSAQLFGEMYKMKASAERKDESQNGAKDRAAKLLEVQHHRAHVASVIAEHSIKGSVIGFAFDGTGYGDDGSVWGSEVFYGKACELKRVAHLKTVKLTGSDESSKNARNSMYAYLTHNDEAVNLIKANLHRFKGFEADRIEIMKKAFAMKLNCVDSSSMGRLFDAVSALLNICNYNSFEAEAAIALENAAYKFYTDNSDGSKNLPGLSDIRIEVKEEKDKDGGIMLIGDTSQLMLSLVKSVCDGKETGYIAYSFIMAVAEFILEVALRIRECNTVVLSGGTFQNRLLLEKAISLLNENGFMVYINEKVPSNDGGICLGQAYIAVCQEGK